MEEPISKSQKRADAEALRNVGKELIALPMKQLDKLPLSDSLRQAIVDAKTITSHGATRRQAQLIGKLMRSADNEAILTAYDALLAEGSAQTAQFHEIELWRDRLINEGKEALTAFISAHPTVDVQKLRQLVKKAIDEQHKDTSMGAHKSLFRFLRSSLE